MRWLFGVLLPCCWHAMVVPASFACGKGLETTLVTRFGKRWPTCVKCLPGRYKAAKGTGRCSFCPKGRNSPNGEEGGTTCTPLAGSTYCPPGRFGQDFEHCRDCPAGRFGRGGSRNPRCSGLCEVGRYGRPGATSKLCTGRCPAGRFCGEGSTGPNDAGICPRGRYALDGESTSDKPEELCPLTAPAEFRPGSSLFAVTEVRRTARMAGGDGAGFLSPLGEMGACVLDKAYRLAEVVFALRTCAVFPPAAKPGELCYAGQAHELGLAFAACCEGNEHMAMGAALATCQTAISPLMNVVFKKLHPLVNAVALEAKRRRPRAACGDAADWAVGQSVDGCRVLAGHLARESKAWMGKCAPGRIERDKCPATCAVCGNGPDPACRDDSEWRAGGDVTQQFSCAVLVTSFDEESSAPGVTKGMFFCREGRPAWTHCRLTCGACTPKPGVKGSIGTVGAMSNKKETTHEKLVEPWWVEKGVSCEPSQISRRTYKSLAAAQRHCGASPECGAIYDDGCDGKGRYMLCGVWPALFRPAPKGCVQHYSRRMPRRAALAPAGIASWKGKSAALAEAEKSVLAAGAMAHTATPAPTPDLAAAWATTHRHSHLEQTVLTVFRQALGVAAKLYASDAHHGADADLTFPAKQLLRPPAYALASFNALAKYTEHWDCNELSCPTPAPTPQTPPPSPVPTPFSARAAAPPGWTCPKGKHVALRQLAEGNNRGSEVWCAMCPAGTFQAVVNTPSQACRPCAVGRWSLRRGATKCQARPVHWSCSSGYFTKLGFFHGKIAPICGMCPPGKFQPKTTGDPCLECVQGTWAPTEGAKKCVPKAEGDIACPPGQYGPVRVWMSADNKMRYKCADCPPGRFSVGNSRDARCSGACAAGRYGTGGSKTARCSGSCPAGRFCHVGATKPEDSGICRAGRYATATATTLSGCTLLSPPEYEPMNRNGKAGFDFAYGQSAACMLDKALRLVELLYALKTCRTFNQPAGSVCYAGTVGDIISGIEACCSARAGAATVAMSDKEAANCKKLSHGLVAMAKRQLEPINHHIQEIAADNDLVDPRWSWKKDKASEQAIILPLFKSALRISKELYQFDDNKDLTWASKTFLEICKLGDCRSLHSIKSVIDKYDCSQIKCDIMTMYEEGIIT